MKYYTGIGARGTPENIHALIRGIARRLESIGYTLRTGGADGADTVFALSVKNRDIYLPWKGFNNICNDVKVYPTREAMYLASNFHHNWDRLSNPVKKLMARNCYQVLGSDLKTPSDFVVCWTPDGCESIRTRTAATGGTGLAIALADHHNIPVFNLYNQDALERLGNLVRSKRHQNEHNL